MSRTEAMACTPALASELMRAAGGEDERRVIATPYADVAGW